MNCPRCNMMIAPGMQVCPNCQLDLQQFVYQQRNFPSDAPVESRKEKQYRLLLIGFFFLIVGQFAFLKFQNLLAKWFTNIYDMMDPVYWLLQIVWGSIPMAIALMLPKQNKLRVILIVLASLYFLWQVGGYFYDKLFPENPYIYYQF